MTKLYIQEEDMDSKKVEILLEGRPQCGHEDGESELEGGPHIRAGADGRGLSRVTAPRWECGDPFICISEIARLSATHTY